MTGFQLAIILMVGLALVSAIGLTLAAKFMAVPMDEKVATLQKALPGANCGGCGFAGCSDYAGALAKGLAEPNLCTAGGPAVAKALGAILGVEADAPDEVVAVVRCFGKKAEKSRRMDYLGYGSCAGAKQFFGGEYGCLEGCMGYGDCQKVCPQQAISVEDGLARVCVDQCIGCGACVKACPNGVIAMVPKSATHLVGCHSTQKGKMVRDNCQVGCIGCKLCEKACPAGAIHVENNLATIDQTKCTHCGACVKVCPRHIIEGAVPV